MLKSSIFLPEILVKHSPRLASGLTVQPHLIYRRTAYTAATFSTSVVMPAFKRKAAQSVIAKDPAQQPIEHYDHGAEDVDVEEAAPTTASAAKRRKIDDQQDNKNKPDYADRSRYQDSREAEEYGICLREYYPPVMSLERASKYAKGEIERPITLLERTIKETRADRSRIEVGESVIHWFKQDLRLQDNKALSMAAEKAKSKGVPLICVYFVSPQDYRAHFTASVRVDFQLRNLELMKKELAELDVPLYVEQIEKRKKMPSRFVELVKEWGAKHVFCNMEYEVDELRREADLTRRCLEAGIDFEVVHDTCVVEPGTLKSNSGGTISVYSPWHRKWCKYIADHPDVLKEWPAPTHNPATAREKYAKLFDQPLPEPPEDKRLTLEEKERYTSLWPCGEVEANMRLDKFLTERIKTYHENRNLPAGDHTSTLSAHFASGTLAARTAVRLALRNAKRTAPTDDRSNGTMTWIAELAWRDFYKHVLCAWPYVCMNVPFKPEYNNIRWEYNDEHFTAWTKGRTGYPIIDAAMRQVHGMAYMHNRVRMNVASFLAKDLMIDWRMGERWFMEHLIDGDFASNNGGWGFSASCGVDPQPYFRIFNPLLQSEKFDASGEYIRRWVPELREVKGKAIHDPYGRGADAIARKNGYPRPIVVHKESRERCLTRYKEGLGRGTA